MGESGLLRSLVTAIKNEKCLVMAIVKKMRNWRMNGREVDSRRIEGVPRG